MNTLSGMVFGAENKIGIFIVYSAPDHLPELMEKVLDMMLRTTGLWLSGATQDSWWVCGKRYTFN